MTLDIGASLPVGGEHRKIQVALPRYGTTIWVVYDPSRYDWKVERALVIDVKETPAGALKDFLSSFVVEWELFENGVYLDPKDDDTYRKLELFDIQMPIAEAITGDMGEGKMRRSASPQLSSMEPQQPQRLPGRDLSPVQP